MMWYGTDSEPWMELDLRAQERDLATARAQISGHRPWVWSAADGSEFLQPPIRASWVAAQSTPPCMLPCHPEAAPCLNPRLARSYTCRILKASIRV